MRQAEKNLLTKLAVIKTDWISDSLEYMSDASMLGNADSLINEIEAIKDELPAGAIHILHSLALEIIIPANNKTEVDGFSRTKDLLQRRFNCQVSLQIHRDKADLLTGAEDTENLTPILLKVFGVSYELIGKA